MRNLFYLSGALLLLLSATAVAEPIKVPSTRVWLDVPPMFKLAADFPGFVSREIQATISVSELPESFVDANDAYDDAGLKRKGVRVVSRDSFERDGLRAILIAGEQEIGERRVAKLLLLTGDVSESLMITATYYAKNEKDLGASLRASLSGVIWNSSEPLNHFEGLGFNLKELPGLRVATRASNSIIFTQAGRLPDEYYTGAMMIVGWSTGNVETVEGPRDFAHAQFKRIQLLNDGEIDNTEYLELDGHQAIEVTGHGRHRNLGYDLHVYQVMVLYKTRYLMAQGFAGGDDTDVVYDKFRAVMGTLATDE